MGVLILWYLNPQMGDRLETETIYSLLNIITVHSDINLNEVYLKCVADNSQMLQCTKRVIARHTLQTTLA